MVCPGQRSHAARAWVLEDDGTWTGEEVELECENEPDMEADEAAWDEWLERHSAMPYVYWLPVCKKVKHWINSQYRFAKGEFEAPLQGQPEWTRFDDLNPEREWDLKQEQARWEAGLE